MRTDGFRRIGAGFAAALLGIAALAGCATRPTSDVPPGPSAVAVPAPAGPTPREVLDTERVRLAELFKGTPVVFMTTSEGNLRATVPRRYCFEPGASIVKPALAAVLGRVAKSQVTTSSRFRVGVPGDPGGRVANLPQERARSVRDWLAAQGIAPARLQVAPATQTEQLELFVVPDSPA